MNLHLNIRPWEISLLTVEQLIRSCHYASELKSSGEGQQR